MRRRLNRRQQGDLGEASAIEWLASRGAGVLVPVGQSRHFDLAADVDGRLFRVQVKTSTLRRSLVNGETRYEVAVATRGGNQSWNRVAKKLDTGKFDLLFVHVGDGRRWLIPAVPSKAPSG